MTDVWPDRALASDCVCLDVSASGNAGSECRGLDKSPASFAALCGWFSIDLQRLSRCPEASQPNTQAGISLNYRFKNNYLDASRRRAQLLGEA